MSAVVTARPASAARTREVARRERGWGRRRDGAAALVWPCVLCVPLIAALSFALGWHVPPHNWDSLTYHLSRAAYWRQWGSLAPFPTNNWRQVAFPGNAELLLLLTLRVAPDAHLAFLVQWCAYLAATAAVYSLSRSCGALRPFALGAAALFATMPEVVLQSNTAQNDLVAAAFLAGGATLCVRAHHAGGRSSLLILAGCALGLASGTKPTVLLALPGLGCGALAVLWARRRLLRRADALCGLGGLCALVLCGAPWYLLNLHTYGHPTGPALIARLQQVAHPGVLTLVTNLVRHALALVDPAGLLYLAPAVARPTCAATTTLAQAVLSALHVPARVPALEWSGTTYSPAPACTFGEDVSWFGLAGALAVATALAVLLGALLRRRRGTCQPVRLVLAAGTCSALLLTCLLLRWQPWEGRLLVPALALAAPLLGPLLQAAWAGRWTRPLAHVFVLYALLGGVSAVLDSSTTPPAALRAPRATWAPQTPGTVLLQEAGVPQSAHVGVFLGVDDADFVLFGPRLQRTIDPLVLTAHGQLLSAGHGPWPWLLVHQPAARVQALLRVWPPQTCRLLRALREAGRADPWRVYRCAARRTSARPRWRRDHPHRLTPHVVSPLGVEAHVL